MTVRLRLLEKALGLVGLVAVVGMMPFTGVLNDARPDVPVRPGTSTALVARAAPTSAARPAAPVCRDDGNSGKRVLALYVHGDQQADRLPLLENGFQSWLAQIDKAFVRAAQQHGGGVRQVRYVRDAQCRPVIHDLTMPQSQMKSVDTVTNGLKAVGYDRSDRKYIVWYDTDDCGVGFGVGGNDLPGWYNLYNYGPHYAAIGTQCWGWAPTLHELLHTLGAVNIGAPHATKNGHCWDDQDVLCYDDGGLPAGGLKVRCPAAKGDDLGMNQIDCNGDDYFNTDPPAGSYLATHWNVADSDFLYQTLSPAVSRVSPADPGEPVRPDRSDHPTTVQAGSGR